MTFSSFAYVGEAYVGEGGHSRPKRTAIAHTVSVRKKRICMDLFCYERIDSLLGNDGVRFKCYFCNIQGEQMVDSYWYYNGKFQSKTLKGNVWLENDEYTFTCSRDHVLHIRIRYKKGDAFATLSFEVMPWMGRRYCSDEYSNATSYHHEDLAREFGVYGHLLAGDTSHDFYQNRTWC